MRGLRKNERRLLALCAATGFLVVNGILWKEYRGRVKEKQEKLAALESEIETNEAVLMERAFWEKRGAWLSENMPRFVDRGAAHSGLLEEMRSSALAHDLDIDQIVLVKPEGSAHFEEVAVTLQLDGPEYQLYRWLASLQAPALFQAIKFLKVYPDQQDARTPEPLGECRVTVARWYQR
ncbi:MAG TPA: hypothetical protein VMN36_07595 [Verrucomicrobiales bacterium]|nr:hypothetical protein [Verrucomicrobiales bacterium]